MKAGRATCTCHLWSLCPVNLTVSRETHISNISTGEQTPAEETGRGYHRETQGCSQAQKGGKEERPGLDLWIVHESYSG